MPPKPAPKQLGTVDAKRLTAIISILQKVAMGDFSSSITLPKDEDELTELRVALNLMINDLREAQKEKSEFEEKIEKEVEAKTRDLKIAKKQAELINRLIPSAVFTVDLDRRVTSWNQAAQKITGYTAEEAIGKECLFFAVDPCQKKCGLYEGKIKKPFYGAECTLKRKDGQIITASKNVDYLRDDRGEVIGGIESFVDITEQKKAMKLMAGRAEELEKMNRLMVGRELRMVELKKRIKELEKKGTIG